MQLRQLNIILMVKVYNHSCSVLRIKLCLFIILKRDKLLRSLPYTFTSSVCYCKYSSNIEHAMYPNTGWRQHSLWQLSCGMHLTSLILSLSSLFNCPFYRLLLLLIFYLLPLRALYFCYKAKIRHRLYSPRACTNFITLYSCTSFYIMYK